MRIKSEQELLDPAVRKGLIDEINADENSRRKREAFRRYECYKDLTKKYVEEKLLDQFDATTVKEMGYAISNVSIVKKIIDKLAKVYGNGAKRTVDGDPVETKEVEDLAKILSFNQSMKKTNRFFKLQNNVLVYVKPCPVINFDQILYKLKLEILNPYLYDIVEDYYDREMPIACILSNYKSGQGVVKYTVGDAASAGRGVSLPSTYDQSNKGNSIDEKIADTPSDAGPKDTYIFWSKSYHFTCNKKGEVISDTADFANPIGTLPFVDFSKDQDGQYWSLGGSDLIDAAILINCLISHMNDLGVRQGHGQFWMSGKGLPKNVVVGPAKVLTLEWEKDEDPEPKLGFAQSNPQLAELRSNVEMYIALTLTMNNLSTSGVSIGLQGTGNFASGISLIIDKAESMEDIKDQEQIFLDKEPKIWEIIGKWLDLYGSKGMLTEEFKDFKLDPNKPVSVKFNQIQPIMSEKEKLENLKLRKDLGLDTMIELLMKDDPALTEEDAKKKLKKILEEKIERMMTMMPPQAEDPNNPQPPVPNEGDEVNGDPEQDDLPN